MFQVVSYVMVECQSMQLISDNRSCLTSVAALNNMCTNVSSLKSGHTMILTFKKHFFGEMKITRTRMKTRIEEQERWKRI